MRREFADQLYKQMKKNKDIILLTGDLGYGMWDKIRDDFPDRFINTGAAEQSLLDISVGLALEGKVPFAYSITPFLIYRGFETIRTYINQEQINVKLIGGGRDDDYKHDGFSHNAGDIYVFMSEFENIRAYYPEKKEEIPELLSDILNSDKPCFVSLIR